MEQIKKALRAFKIIKHREIIIKDEETRDSIEYNSKNCLPIKLVYKTPHGEDVSEFKSIEDMETIIKRITKLKNALKKELA